MDIQYTVKLEYDDVNSYPGYARVTVDGHSVSFDIQDPDRRIVIGLKDLKNIVKREECGDSFSDNED